MNGLRKKSKDKTKIMTFETWGMVLTLLSLLCLICLVTNDLIFGKLGVYCNRFFLGVFGYTAYAVCACLSYVGLMMITGKRPTPSFKVAIFLILTVLSFVLLLHSYTVRDYYDTSFGNYLSLVFKSAKDGISSSSAGGVIFGAICYPFLAILTHVGSYIFFALALGVSVFFLFKFAFDKFLSGEKPSVKQAPKKKKSKKPVDNNGGIEISGVKDYPVAFHELQPERKVKLQLFGDSELDFEPQKKRGQKKENAVIQLFGEHTEVKSDFSSYQTMHEEGVLDGKKDVLFSSDTKFFKESGEDKEEIESQVVKPPKRTFDDESGVIKPLTPIEFSKPSPSLSREKDYFYDAVDAKPVKEEKPLKGETIFEEKKEEVNPFDSFHKVSLEREEKTVVETEPKEEIIKPTSRIISAIEPKEDKASIEIKENPLSKFKPKVNDESAKVEMKMGDSKIISAPSRIEVTPSVVRSTPYRYPPLDYLTDIDYTDQVDEDELKEKSEIIENTLRDYKYPCQSREQVVGPRFTRFEFVLDRGVSLKGIVSCAEDVSRELMAKEEVRIIPRISGTDRFGVEVANKTVRSVFLKELLTSTEYKNMRSKGVCIPVGIDVAGQVSCVTIEKLPHLLVAGATGSGKSVFLNTLITSILYNYTPQEIRLLTVDPKKVELLPYVTSQHMLIKENITEPSRAANMLIWLVEEMNNRNDIFASCEGGNIRSVDEYNVWAKSHNATPMYKILVVIDEYAQLVSDAGQNSGNKSKEIEKNVCSIAQMGRAAGIHLLIATQRPSVDIITGTIKNNFPTRICFRLSSFIDSKTMFDESGAEKLYGQGDMLFRNSSGEMSRLQGAYMSNEEIGAVVDFVKEHNTPVYDERLKDFLDAEEKKAEMVANDMMVKKVDENTFGQGNQLSIEDDII